MPDKDFEIDLIKRISKGDTLAFDELYRQYYNKTYSFSCRYLQNKQDAEEVVQDVFIKVWENREKLKEINNLNSWLFTVTFNQIRKRFRNMVIEKRKMETVALSAVFENNTVLSEIEFDDLMRTAGSFIDRIPPRQKTVLLLNIKEGLSSTEISKKLNINKRTVENHLSKARAFLKRVFKEEHLIPLILLWLIS